MQKERMGVGETGQVTSTTVGSKILVSGTGLEGICCCGNCAGVVVWCRGPQADRAASGQAANRCCERLQSLSVSLAVIAHGMYGGNVFGKSFKEGPITDPP